jgi:hypothetical protein
MKNILFCLLSLSTTAFASPLLPMTSPHDVVAPILNGDPSGSARVSGQLYLDATNSAFKGIDNLGNVATFLKTSDAGTTANKIVQLDGAGKLPAVDGSQLTNLPSGGGGGSSYLPFSVTSTTHTLDASTEKTVLVDTTSASVSITLPASQPDGTTFTVKSESGSNNIYIYAASPTGLEGSSSGMFAHYESRTYVYSSADQTWYIVASWMP